MVDPMFPFGNVGLDLLRDTLPPMPVVDILTDGVYPLSRNQPTGENNMSVEATEKPLDWSHVTAATATRLRKPKVEPVPPHIVALAQQSWDDKEVKEHDFGTSEAQVKRAAEFFKLIKKAGAHTSPQTSVSAAIDPEEEGRAGYVRWVAGNRRGRGGPSTVGA